MSRVHNSSALASFIMISQLLTIAGHAQTPGVTFSETDGNAWDVGDVTRGYTIDVTQSFAVSALGVFDSGGEALFTSHNVAIWNATGHLLAQTVVPAGAGATTEVINQFRYLSITPVTLAPGDYTVGTYYPVTTTDDGLGDPILINITDVAANPDLTIVSYEFAHPGGFQDPAGDLADEVTFGANFLLTQVPEPSTVALIGLGAAALMARRRANGLA
jgi:hypothetical protein